MFVKPTIIQDTETHRTCSVCQESKTLDCFYKDGKGSDGITRYRRDCKQCYTNTRMKTKLKKTRRPRK